MEKSTTDGYRTELFMPIMKECEGKYIAVLSDNSIDRDDEKVSKGCIERLGRDGGYLAALCNHDNDIFMQVAEWTNRGVKEIDGYTALIAEPRFFEKSSPQARQIKGMLDEGAKMGISIGAIVKDFEEIDGMKIFTELELIEASFVAVPSNRHGRALAVAKSFNKRNPEGSKMEKEFTQKDVDSAVEKKAKEIKADFTKQLETKDAEIEKLKADIKEKEAGVGATTKELEKKLAGETLKVEAAEKKTKAAEKKAKDAEDAALEKQNLADQAATEKKTEESEEAKKAYEAGELPVMRVA